MRAMRLRPYDATDAEAVLALNQANLDAVATLDTARLAWLVGMADMCLVAEADGGQVVGFTIVLTPGTAYDSINYRWFRERLGDFSYLDRVVVSPDHRRSGIGSAIYDAAEERARERGLMALEVYVEPPNGPSIEFHRRRDYVEMGRLPQGNGKVSSMLVKQLP